MRKSSPVATRNVNGAKCIILLAPLPFKLEYDIDNRKGQKGKAVVSKPERNVAELSHKRVQLF